LYQTAPHSMLPPHKKRDVWNANVPLSHSSQRLRLEMQFLTITAL
jgi:hypothetical protein